jgi:hypothetical protein
LKYKFEGKLKKQIGLSVFTRKHINEESIKGREFITSTCMSQRLVELFSQISIAISFNGTGAPPKKNAK